MAIAQTTAANYDGNYSGMDTLIPDANNHKACLGGPFQRTLVVQSGIVTFSYNKTFYADLKGTVGPDGTVTASVATAAGGANLTGKIQGKTFTGRVGSALCAYSLQLTKR
jgi:hypothetical protein